MTANLRRVIEVFALTVKIYLAANVILVTQATSARYASIPTLLRIKFNQTFNRLK